MTDVRTDESARHRSVEAVSRSLIPTTSLVIHIMSQLLLGLLSVLGPAPTHHCTRDCFKTRSCQTLIAMPPLMYNSAPHQL